MLSIEREDTRDATATAKAVTVYVCVTCRGPGGVDIRPRPGELVAAATEKAADGTDVRVCPIECLANCSRGPSAAVRCRGSWTYVFGGLDAGCGEALVEGAHLLAESPDGIMPWRGRPEPLKRGLVARVPPMDCQEVDS